MIFSAFVLCLLALSLLLGIVAFVRASVRPRNRRVNRRLRNLRRKPLPDPWSGAICDNWRGSKRAVKAS